MHMYVTNNEVDHFEVHSCKEMTNYTYFCVSKRSVPVSGMGQNEQSDADPSKTILYVCGGPLPLVRCVVADLLDRV